MKRLTYMLFVVLLPLMSMGQGQATGTISNNPNVSNPTSNDLIQTFDLRKEVKVTRVFVSKNWTYGHIIKNDGTTTKDKHILNYDLLNETLIVKINRNNFIFPNHMMKGFMIEDLERDREFSKFKINGKERVLEKMVDGEYSLFRLDDIEVKSANYVPALDVGNSGESSVVKEKFYMLVNDQLKAIDKKKKIAEKTFNKYPGFKKYSESKKINFKKQEDLIDLFLFLNNSNN